MNTDELELQDVDSILNFEIDEFNKIFTKLISSPQTSIKGCFSGSKMQSSGQVDDLARTSLTPDGKANASGKKLGGDSLMGSMPSLGRYSSLPNRHFLKQKNQPPGRPTKPKSAISCFEECESSVSDVAGASLPATERNPDDASMCSSDAIIADSTVCSDIIRADTCQANIQQSEVHHIDVGHATDDTRLTDDAGSVDQAAINNSARRMNPFFECDALLPSKKHLKYEDSSPMVHAGACRPDIWHADLPGFDIKLGNVCSDVQQSSTMRSEDSSMLEGLDTRGRAGVSSTHVVDRIAMDDFVMSLVPSFGRYTSLPPKNSFQQVDFSSPSRFSQRTPDSKNRIKPHNTEQCLGGIERMTGDRPLSDDIDLRRLSERYSMPSHQSKSYGDLDMIERLEPFPAFLPLQHFDDSLKEFATDSAYQTSDTLKLGTYSLSKEELRSRIENINLSKDGFKINMDPESDVYHGSIPVVIDLIRPVDICISERRPSFTSDNSQVTSETRNEENETMPVSPFYLPRSYLTTVHISSETTTEQLIKEVLNKFNIMNHSGRFALFEKVNRKPDEGHSNEGSSTVYLRKLAAKERPLELCLRSGDENVDAFEQRQFLLRENDKGEILWEAFSLPELNMFLDILLLEEESYIKAIHQKYSCLRTAFQEKLDLEYRQNYDFLSRIKSPRNKSFEQRYD